MTKGKRSTLSADEIKALARSQMATKGSAGLSLRGIARELGVTAPAIYNYFPRMDDLITALIVDAFNGHADAIDAAIAKGTPDTLTQLEAGLHAYRNWALANPEDFKLIYGNPIPGYEAPADVTIPLARRPQVAFYTQMLLLWQDGRLTIPALLERVPQRIADHMDGWLYRDFPELAAVPKGLFLLMQSLWARIHGIVMLELLEHISPAIGDMDAFYALEVQRALAEAGIS